MTLKNILLSIVILTTISRLSAQDNSNFITYDIDNFWTAYDKIRATKDSAQQYEYINKLFIEKGSPGLKAIMEVRDYTAQSYVEAINNYPLFWNSIRENTFRSKGMAKDIEQDVQKIKALYPALKPAKIYFTIGAFRTGGTTLEDMVLIGSEIALADKNIVTTEFSSDYDYLKNHFATDPIKNIVPNNVHEYVHTQQKTTIGDNLLAQSVLEGVAEFVMVKSTGKPSISPALAYGKTNPDKIREKFATQMFNPFTGFWLYSNQENEFGTRDLGYYVGYTICEKYYEKAADKKQAIKDMIELDYNNLKALKKFTERSGYFKESLSKIEKRFEKSRPTVTGIKEFKNKSQNVNAALTQITFEFSVPIDKRYRNFELGPLGEDNLLRFTRFVDYGADGKSAIFEIAMEPEKRYQILVGGGFRDEQGNSLKPFLVDFKTGK